MQTNPFPNCKHCIKHNLYLLYINSTKQARLPQLIKIQNLESSSTSHSSWVMAKISFITRKIQEQNETHKQTKQQVVMDLTQNNQMQDEEESPHNMYWNHCTAFCSPLPEELSVNTVNVCPPTLCKTNGCSLGALTEAGFPPIS